jgi:hypothetical protein
MTTTTSFASIVATMKEQSKGLVTAMSDMTTKTRDGMAESGSKMRAGGGSGGSGGFISSIADAGAKTLLKVRKRLLTIYNVFFRWRRSGFQEMKRYPFCSHICLF